MLHIVTDSTSDMTRETAARLGVTVVPLSVRFGNEEFKDGVDIDADAFYRKLRTHPEMPTTSQPSPDAFTQAYGKLLESPDDRVLSLHLAQEFSGTLQSASLAAQDFDGRVTVVDSRSVSVGIQFLIRAALEDMQRGADADTVIAGTEARRQRVDIYVMLDSLTYLQKGGRIGRAQALLGGVLKVKPILRVVEGSPEPYARVRSRRHGVARLLELVRSRGPMEAVATMHSDAPDLLRETRDSLEHDFPELEIVTGQLGPVVGTYAGPAAIGVAFMRAS